MSGDGEMKVVDRRWWAQQSDPSAAAAGTDGEWKPGKPTYVEELERQLAEKERQLQETLAKYREAAREFEDARARLRKDVARDVERGRRVVLAELLEVIDNLDRAVDAARTATSTTSVADGIEMVRRQFLATLETFGVVRVEAQGQAFNPELHEAVSTIPTSDPDQDGRVAGVLTPGYVIQNDVLRPARVAVTQLSTTTSA